MRIHLSHKLGNAEVSNFKCWTSNLRWHELVARPVHKNIAEMQILVNVAVTMNEVQSLKCATSHTRHPILLEYPGANSVVRGRQQRSITM